MRRPVMPPPARKGPPPGSQAYIRIKRAQAERRHEIAQEQEQEQDQDAGTDGFDLGVATTAAARRRTPPPPKAAVIVHKARVEKLRVVAEKKHGEIDRKHRAVGGQVNRISNDIEHGKIPPEKKRLAVAKRRQLAAQETALHLRRMRAKLAKKILARAAREKDRDTAEGLRRAAAAVMTAPLVVRNGKVVPVCPQGYHLGDLGLPGGAYTGAERVPQYRLPGTEDHDGGEFRLRHALLAAVGGLFASRPPDVQLPTLAPIPQAVVAAQPHLPRGVGVSYNDAPVFTLPAPPVVRHRPPVPAAVQHPAYRPRLLPGPALVPVRAPAGGIVATPVRVAAAIRAERREDRQEAREDRQEAREDRREAAIRRRVRLSELGGLSEDMVIADVFGAYDLVVGGVESEMSSEDLGGLGKIGKRPRKWADRLRIHKTRLGRGALATLIGLSAVGAGHPGAAAILAKEIVDDEAQGQADEETAAVEAEGTKVDGGRRAKHLGFLRRWIRKHAGAVKCVKG